MVLFIYSTSFPWYILPAPLFLGMLDKNMRSSLLATSFTASDVGYSIVGV